MNDLLISAGATFALASLSKQLLESADKVAVDQRAREKVFRAAQKLYPGLSQNQKELVVNYFEQVTRGCAAITVGSSIFCAMKLLNSNL